MAVSFTDLATVFKNCAINKLRAKHRSLFGFPPKIIPSELKPKNYNIAILVPFFIECIISHSAVRLKLHPSMKVYHFPCVPS